MYDLSAWHENIEVLVTVGLSWWHGALCLLGELIQPLLGDRSTSRKVKALDCAVFVSVWGGFACVHSEDHLHKVKIRTW